MEVLRISGPSVLEGTARVQGSKNAVLPMIVSSVINRGITVLRNCPDISDVRDAVEILRYIGCSADFSGGVLRVDSSGEIINSVPEEIMSRTRASFLFTGALLARCGSFTVFRPGGCNIGERPVDIHLESFRRLGAVVETSSAEVSCRLPRLTPCDLTLRFPSVGATENIMIFASGLKCKIRICNAAREPEIVDLQNMLNSMGAHITGAGTTVITVEGTGEPGDTDYTVMSDRIDAATYLTALGCTEGSIALENAEPEYILNYINILRKCGMEIDTASDKIYARKHKRLKGGINVTTKPYPGFATDTQSLLMAVLSLSDGVSLIRENIFENRFAMTDTLTDMGADIRIYRRTASVRGVRSLEPLRADICDLRSGAAIAAAMMSCDGVSELGYLRLLDRGYEDFCGKYKALGVGIERVEISDE